MGPKIARHGVLLSSKAASGDLFQDANRLWKEGRFIEAEKAYLAILEEKPDSAWALYRLGEARQRNGDGEGADALFERAIALNPALAQGHASTTFWRRFKFANELLEQRNLIGAERIFRDLLALDADCAPVLAKLGRIEGEHGRIQEALACYERAIAADGDYVWGPIGKAEMLDAAGDLEGAANILEAVLQRDPSMNLAQDRLQALRRRQRMNAQGVRIRHWPANVPRDTAVHGPRVAVVSWCLAHNPVGRAMILADVTKTHAACEIVGPIFPAYGEDLWPPLRDGARDVDIRGFLAPSFAAFMEGAIRLVVERPCDVAWVSKPRLPSLLIGFLYKLIHGASVILDIDDDELAFVRADHPLSFDEFLCDQSAADWREPYAKRWTQLAAAMIKSADAITVCNPVLQRKFGGFLLRHARDAAPFALARARRDAVREGIRLLGRRQGRAVPRDAAAPQGRARRRRRVAGTGRSARRVLHHRHGARQGAQEAAGIVPRRADRASSRQPYSRLAEMNAMADVVCILQDPLDPITQSQTPAKLTDAIATGTPILATAVPPVLDMIDGGKITAVSEGNLVEALRAVLSGADAGAADARRAWFASELSTEVNAGRACEVIAAAREKSAPVPGDIMRLFAHIDAFMPGSLPRECTRATKGAFRDGARAGVLCAPRRGVNLVFFWKQNDSGIYGRRQDMLLERFASMPRIERILHIDAPISVDALNRLAGSGPADGQGRLVAANTVARFLGTADDSRIARRCFVHRGKETQFLGRELAGIESFPNVVEAWLGELGMSENLLAWVCPVVRGFPEVQKRLGFSFVAADVIDDQRQWPMQPSWRQQLEQNYHDTFAVADVAFANCAPVARWLEDEGLSPTIVPNGMDVRLDAGSWEIPKQLSDLPRPIVGYCGSLSHRIDWTCSKRWRWHGPTGRSC